ncbi:MAG: WbqC family protein [Desulfobacteraceae bacterium]|nr:WbqC family protein [Desulfobacteraceae bacterium]MBC2718833.1 WbqC family protein [Desulfobacteraceae bacterium]
MEKANRLIQITKELGYKAYVNASGGKELYTKDYFMDKGIDLSFVKSNPIEYKQYSNKFVPCLSIIDILMFNEKDRIVEFFSAYSLE